MHFASSTGNADPERVFSVNKMLLEKHGTNIDEGTLEALRVIKDYLIQVGEPVHVKINKKCWSLVNIHVRSTKRIWMLKTRKSEKKVKRRKRIRKLKLRRKLFRSGS